MLLLLKSSPEQQQELENLLSDLQDPASPRFHQWLTPEEFGDRFGLSSQDVQTVAGWLQGNGFQIDRVAKSRTAIEFSGTAENVWQAFQTRIHRYIVNGKEHWANAGEPSVPAALAGVVQGFASLNNFHSTPQIRSVEGPLPKDTIAAPQTTFGGGYHALSPADLATIYNIAPLYQASVTGAGSTIAVLGRTNINVQDVADFRNLFGLPANPPQVIVNGADPGNLGAAKQWKRCSISPGRARWLGTLPSSS